MSPRRKKTKETTPETSSEKTKKTTKYKATKVTIDEIVFDSKAEGKYYEELKRQKEKGIIQNFSLQPTFLLQEAFKKNGKSFRKIEYRADFKIFYPSGEVEIIDVKGMVTPEFKIKQKMFEYKYPDISLKIIKEVQKYGGWIEFDEWQRLKREEKKQQKKANKEKEKEKK